MHRRTKNRLLIAIIVAMIILVIAWRLTAPRQEYYKVDGLRAVYFDPNSSPALTFVFAADFDPTMVRGSTAFLKEFAISASGGPNTQRLEAGLLAALQKGGGVPFTPEISTDSVITTNTIAKDLVGFESPLSIIGFGRMWFTKPS